jgi:hypothetical protein
VSKHLISVTYKRDLLSPLRLSPVLLTLQGRNHGAVAATMVAAARIDRWRSSGGRDVRVRGHD